MATMAFFLDFFRDLTTNRKLVWRLALRQFLSGTFGSTFGMLWVLAEPIIYVGVLYIFFTKAARFTPSGDAPYLPWLMCAMSVWQLFTATTTTSLRTFQNYSYFLKKWGFNLSILPVANIISNLFLHLIFLCILLVVFVIMGIPFSAHWFQVIYYAFALVCLMVGLSWTLGSIFIFFQDLGNIVAILLQLGFWISPIFWDVQSSPMGLGKILKWNPLNYVMQGYRDSFLFGIDLSVRTSEAIAFWAITGLIWFIGMVFYRRLRPNFGDVLI